MSQPKPNTMDDTADEILRVCGFVEDEWGNWHFPNSSGANLGQGTMSEAKALITAKLQEVDRAARTIKLAYYEHGQVCQENTFYLATDTTHQLQLDRMPGHYITITNPKASLKGGDV